MKKLYILLLCLFVCVGLTGCSDGNGNANDGSTVYNPFSNTGKSSDDDKEPTNTNSSQIKIEDLDWEVTEGVYGNKRQLLFSYSNNSKYDVIDFNVNFDLKPNLTEEEMKLIDDIKDFVDSPLTDEEKKGLYIMCPNGNYDNTLINTGEALPPKPCYLGSKSKLVHVDSITKSLYDLMNPNLAKIKYVSDGKLYLVNYDFKNKNYTQENVKEANQWSDSDLAKMLPVPDIKIGEKILEDEDYYSFRGFGVDADYYNKYKLLCKEYGFNIDPYESEIVFSAFNKEGYEVEVTYNDIIQNMHISINKPK